MGFQLRFLKIVTKRLSVSECSLKMPFSLLTSYYRMYNGPNDEFPKLEECLRDRLLERQMYEVLAIINLFSSLTKIQDRQGHRVIVERVANQ